MKNILCLLLFPVLMVGQEELRYSKVIDAPGLSLDEIYLMAKSFIAEKYRSANHVIQLDERGSGRIIIKPKIQYTHSGLSQCHSGWIRYTVSIDIKDGRFKVDVYQMYHEIRPTADPSCEFGLITTLDEYRFKGVFKKSLNSEYVKCKNFLESYFYEFYESFEDFAKKNPADQSNDDW